MRYSAHPSAGTQYFAEDMVRFGDPSGMVMTMSEMQRHDDEATAREAMAQTAAQSQPDSATDSTPFEPLTATYERLRHSTDSA